MPLIHPFTHPITHTFTHQRRLAAMQGTNQLVRSNWGLGVLLRDTSTHPGWDRTGNPPTARWQLLPPVPYRPCVCSTRQIAILLALLSLSSLFCPCVTFSQFFSFSVFLKNAHAHTHTHARTHARTHIHSSEKQGSHLTITNPPEPSRLCSAW